MSRTRAIFDFADNVNTVTTTPDIAFNGVLIVTLDAATTTAATFTVNGTSGARQFVLNTSQDANQIDIDNGDAVNGFVIYGSPSTTLTLHNEDIVGSTFTDIAGRTFTITHNITDTVNAGEILQSDRYIEKEQHIVTPIFDILSDSTFAYNNVGTLIVNGTVSGGIYNVQSTSPSTQVTINAGSHAIVVPGGPAQSMDGVTGLLTVNGTAGTFLELSDQANGDQTNPVYSAISRPTYTVTGNT